MRILVTVPWAQRLGGAEEMLQTALAGAAVARHDVEVVFMEPGPWADELAGRGFHVETLSAGRLREPLRFARTVLGLREIMRRRRPDLILDWMPKTHLYGAPAAVLAGMRDRLVWWQHGIPQGEWIDRLVTLLPARAVGCSSPASAREQARLWPPRRTIVVAPGSPPPQPHANGSPAAAPASPVRTIPTVGLVGRLQPLKGQHRLLEAQALLRERGLPIHTVLVGGDAHELSPDYAQSLPALVERLHLGGEVTMTGQVDDAGPYIERMDILVSASDPPEAFGIVLLEAMARGVAVVAVDAGAPGELIEDGRTGVLAGSAEPQALAEALERLLRAPQLRASVALEGRRRYMEEFTDAAMCKRFYEQLESVASEGSARA